MPGQSANAPDRSINVRPRLEAIGILVEKPNASREFYNLERVTGQDKPEGTHFAQVEGGWLFSLLGAVPGPSGDEFEMRYSSLDDAIAAVKEFYFGQPVLVDGWSIPFHQHPNWNRKQIERVVKDAVMISPDEFRRRINERWEEFRRSGPHPAGASPLSAHYLAFTRQRDPSKTLQLCVDLSVAYIVDAPMSSMRAQGWLARARRLFGR